MKKSIFLIAIVALLALAGFVIRGSTVFSGPVTVPSVAGTLTLPEGTVFKITGNQKITRIVPVTPGRFIVLYHASTDTLVDGLNLKLAGNFNGTADDVINLVGVDTVWAEISRAAN